MKLSRYFSTLLWVLPALMLAACSDDTEPVDVSALTPADGAGVEELTLTLNLPSYEVTEIGSRAAAIPTETIDAISVFCYGADGNWLQTVVTDERTWTLTGGKAVITVGINKKTAKVEVVTNYKADSNAKDPSTIFVGTEALNPAKPVMWGKADISSIAGSTMGNATVDLLRNYAKVTVKKAQNAVGTFTINTFGVTNTAMYGSLAPSNKSLSPVAPSPKSGETYGFKSAAVSASEAVYIYETPKDESNADGTLKSGGRIIINIDGSYYCVAFRQRNALQGADTPTETPGAYTYTSLHILRNHHYTVNVIEVREDGWSTFEEAMNAAPDNRLTVLITDETPAVTNVAATRDYMLGVSDAFEAEAVKKTYNIIVVTSYLDGELNVAPASSDASWINVDMSNATVKTVTGITEGANSTGKQYTIPVTIDDTQLAEPRPGSIIATAGVLKCSIEVTQAGRDYRRDPYRKVQMRLTSYGTGNATVSENDYFAWIDDVVQGLLPEQNRNCEVNQGLHFPAVPVYTCYYLIPKLTTSETSSVTSGFTCKTVTVSGKDYWQVECPNSSSQVSLSSTDGRLIITNAQGIQIKYPLYRRGVFHKIEPAAANVFEPVFTAEDASKLKSGWFYYGVAPVGSNYVLDRNLGASNNDYYSPTSSNFVGNVDARGGYFKVATSKSRSQAKVATTVNSKDALNFKKFRLPLDSELEAWGINYRTPMINGEETVQYYLPTSSSYFSDGCIYIPAAGYYEGNTQRYETHANLWTQTLLAGNQGFSPTSPDFGYWFIYFNGYNKQVTFSNMRFANGASGQAPTSTSIYKYMPMRLVYDPTVNSIN